MFDSYKTRELRRWKELYWSHISARWKDLKQLMNGLIRTGSKLEKEPAFDAVLAAAIIAFGFVSIHPFVDGNGRIHRYLIHACTIPKRIHT